MANLIVQKLYDGCEIVLERTAALLDVMLAEEESLSDEIVFELCDLRDRLAAAQQEFAEIELTDEAAPLLMQHMQAFGPEALLPIFNRVQITPKMRRVLEGMP